METIPAEQIVAIKTRGLIMKKYILVLCLFFIGCTMTAIKKGDVIVLKGFGSGEAEYPDGTKIKKGLVTLPQIRLDN